MARKITTGEATTSVLRAALAAATVLAAAGCGGTVQPTVPTTGGEPPTVTVRGAGEPVGLQPWTWCSSDDGSGTCADGSPPPSPPDVGTAEQVTVSLPRRGWTFDATFRPVDAPAGREQPVDLAAVPAADPSDTSGGTLVPPARAGTYDVDVSGHGSSGNDVHVTFRWTTPPEGPASASS